MVSMKTRTERTLFFDFLPLDLGDLGGFQTRFLLYTVPGQVYYNATRKLVLKGVDAVIFVADSERGKMDENIESLENLRENLKEQGVNPADIPLVIQYNKRDLPDVYSIVELEQALNPMRVPTFEAVATTGEGVFETFKGVARLLLSHLSRRLGPKRSLTDRGRDEPTAGAATAGGPAATSSESPAAGGQAPESAPREPSPMPSPEPHPAPIDSGSGVPSPEADDVQPDLARGAESTEEVDSDRSATREESEEWVRNDFNVVSGHGDRGAIQQGADANRPGPENFREEPASPDSPPPRPRDAASETPTTDSVIRVPVRIRPEDLDRGLIIELHLEAASEDESGPELLKRAS
jgi:signal recognition particle receptor subunit beta